nr:hypothetical protein CFP56_00279 [Quercus suber]
MQREHAATTSRAVDLDQVAARLQAVPADHEPFSRSTSPAITLSPLPQEEQDLEDLQKEKRSYHELVTIGGRAPYPLHMLEDFFWHPEQFLEHEQYCDVVKFWRGYSLHEAERTCFCARQLSHWKCFRKAQRIIRQRSVKNEWTLMDAAGWDSWEAFVDRYGPNEGEWGFSEYVESVSRRLAKYGFTRPFQLDRDPDRQDKLTTWIEYLGYEYRPYDLAASYVKRSQRRHDEAWTKLVESNVLRPHETYETICDFQNVIRNASEEERAEKDVESAAAAVLSTEKAISQSLPPDAIIRGRLLAAQSTLSTAKERCKTIKVRNDAITDFCQATKRYQCEKRDADQHCCLLRWIEQQVPSIEHELSSVDSVEDDPDRTDSVRGLKRARTVEHSEAPSWKRMRSEGNTQSLSARRAASNSPEPSSKNPKCSRNSSIDNGRALKQVKYTSQSRVSPKSNPVALASMTSASIPGTTASQALGGVKGSSKNTIEEVRPLRRSVRIAEKREALARIAPVPLRLSPTAPKKSRARSKVTRTKESRP